MNILAVGCHPDDLEIACGGTLAKYAREGHAVYMCHVANGDKGHVVILPEELRRMRHAEAEASGKVLGVREVIDLDVPDLDVDSKNESTVAKLVDVIRRVQPDVILTHNPDDYMRDHMEVSRLVYNASFSSSIPHYFTEHDAYAKIAPVFHMDTLAGMGFLPGEYVDVTGTLETKCEALKCHVSQLKWLMEHDGVDFLDMIRTIAKFRGYQSGVQYAEGFRRAEMYPRMSTARLLP
jgi:N-acetylglucosamine malate deacetylase 1